MTKQLENTPARIANQDAAHEAFIAERKLRDISNVPDPRDHDERIDDENWQPIATPKHQHRFDSRIDALHEEGDQRASKDHLLPLHQRLARHMEVYRDEDLANEAAAKARHEYLKSIAADIAKFDTVERRILENKDLFDKRDFENLRKGREQLKAGAEFDKDIAFDFLAKVAAKEQTVLAAKRHDLLGQRAALDSELAKVNQGIHTTAESEAEAEGESDFDRQLREWKTKKQLLDDAVARNDIGEAYRLLGVEPPETASEETNDQT
jgi:hypothetical protein